MHLESAAVSPGARNRGLGGHQGAGARPPGIRLGAGRDPLRPQDTQPSDIDLWRREITVRGRAGKPGRPYLIADNSTNEQIFGREACLRGEGDRFVVTIGDRYRDGSAGVAGYRPPAGARRDRPWKAGIQPGRIRPAPSRTTLPARTLHRDPASQGPVAMAVTVPQLGPVLNPHGPDLRKYPSSDCREVLPDDISAGQAMITMCPRTDCTKKPMHAGHGVRP
jgi:hypothetical protein